MVEENPYTIPADLLRQMNAHSMQVQSNTIDTPRTFKMMPKVFLTAMAVTYGIHMVCSGYRDTVNALLPPGMSYPSAHSPRETAMLLFTTCILPIFYYRIFQTLERKEILQQSKDQSI